MKTRYPYLMMFSLFFVLTAGVNAANNDKVTLCHLSPDDPNNAHSIMIPATALEDHLAHGDTEGACGTGEQTEGCGTTEDALVCCDTGAGNVCQPPPETCVTEFNGIFGAEIKVKSSWESDPICSDAVGQYLTNASLCIFCFGCVTETNVTICQTAITALNVLQANSCLCSD